MARDKKLDRLGKVRLFSSCTSKELAQIGKASDEITVPAGKDIVTEGTGGHEFFLILDGEAAVTRAGKQVATLHDGDYFGELALLDRAPRNATVTASRPTNLLVIGQREFSGVLDEVAGLAHKLLIQMAARLREADAQSVSH
ncbi:MAG TPA: cyclic nucleotide-binding domain-containing protein [Acidimicrobiales bacterium]|jgi:CRP-like cAMP-binding protein